MRAILLSIILMGVSSMAKAGEAEEKGAILKVIDDFFIGLARADADAMESLMAPHAMDVIVVPGSDNKVRTRPSSSSFEQMRSGNFPEALEWYWDPIVLQRGRLAVVWAPYEIDINDGERGHCGIDVFNMSKPEDRWLIDTIHYTVEPDACDEIAPGEGVATRPDFSVLDKDDN